MSEYTEQAEQFANKYGIKLQILSNRRGKHFDHDKESRMIYKCKLSRKGKSYTFEFGASLAAPSEPDMYSILACLEKYGYEDFEDFCANLGYDEDSRKAERIYKAVVKEFKAVERLFGDILEELQEIQ